MKKKIIKILKMNPYIYAFLKFLLFKYTRFIYLQRSKKWNITHERDILYFDPNKITKYLIFSTKKFNKRKDKNKILDGQWDTQTGLFSDLDVYISLVKHFKEKIEWKKTPFYKRVLSELEAGEVKWGCKSEDQFLERLYGLDQLYEEIKVNGFKSQKEINTTDSCLQNLFDEVAVCIDRNGEPLFFDGRHRLAIAKILNIKKIPIHVIFRHKKWNNFTKEVIEYSKKHENYIYSPIVHPDLSHIFSTHDDYRFHIIKNNLPIQSGSLLDIGSHWGYFCHMFEDCGFNCYAVENDLLNLHFLNKIKKSEQKNFSVLSKSIFDIDVKNDFDVVLALYIFHHFLKKQEQYEQLIEFLKNLKVKVMILGCHNKDEAQMKGSYINYSSKEFVDFIIKNSNLTKAKKVGDSKENREIYMLTEK